MRIYGIILFAFVFLTAYGQDNQQEKSDISPDFTAWEKSLVHLEMKLADATNQMERYELNNIILDAFDEILHTRNSIRYPFDSLRMFSVLTSTDRRLRIVSWMILHDNGTCMHYGYVQAYSKLAKKYIVYPLLDNSENIRRPENARLSPENWYGAYYYDIITTKYRRNVVYTLLGWDKNNFLSQKKLIEIVSLSPNGRVRFGNSIFTGERARYMRRIFEYSATSHMILRYERQTYSETKITKDARPRRRTRRQEKSFAALKRDLKPVTKTTYHTKALIVFDELRPIHPNAEGIYSMYVADGDSHLAYEFDRGRWRLITTVQARNPQPKGRQPKPRKVEYELFPPKAEPTPEE